MALSPRMPDLAAFEVLLAVAKTGSLGAAGREVGLTQQAVSARMASIEARTGVRLAVRTPRGSQLTPAGVVVAEWADQLLGVAQHVDAGLASLREGSRAGQGGGESDDRRTAYAAVAGVHARRRHATWY